MVSRKDYVRIAKALKDVREGYGKNWNANLFRALNDAACALADTLREDNPRFDRARFLAACGVPD